MTWTRCFRIIWWRGCGEKLIYDTHEFYTEVPELVRRPRIRAVWLAIEQ